MRDGREVSGIIQKLDPISGRMVARVRAGSAGVRGEDQIIFTYQNATAPQTPERSMFTVFFDNLEVTTLPVVVQSATGATRLAVSAYPATFSRDAGATHTSSTVTVKLQDDSGNAAAPSERAHSDFDFELYDRYVYACINNHYGGQ